MFSGQPGGVDWNVVRAFSRVFARAISGTPTSMSFDADNRLFRLEWNVDQSIEQPTEIFVPRLHYPTGFSVRVADGLSWIYSDVESLVFVVIDKPSQTLLPLTTAFVVIEPKWSDGQNIGYSRVL
jgi:Glycoside hydrolase family 5 C-terminal domain